MLRTSFLLLLLSLCAARLAAQKLPAGYSPLPDAAADMSIQADLDGDGKADVFSAVVKDGEGVCLLAQLTTGTTIHSGPLEMCCGSISVRGNVVDVHSTGMRGFTYYKFRWDKGARDFRLIGYDTESFGNAANDGSGTSSINLLTGDYEAAFNSWNEQRQELMALPKVKRKITVGRKIYLRNFDEAAWEWLLDLNYRYLPKAVQ